MNDNDLSVVVQLAANTIRALNTRCLMLEALLREAMLLGDELCVELERYKGMASWACRAYDVDLGDLFRGFDADAAWANAEYDSWGVYPAEDGYLQALADLEPPF